MILYIIFGLIFLALIVIAILSSKELHWVNSLILIFLFLSTAAASMGMAGVLHKRTKAVTKLNKIEQQLEKTRDDYNKAVFGDADAIGFGKKSLRALSAQLDLLQVGRGRVWNGGKVVSGDGAWTYTFADAVPEGGENQLSTLEEIEVHVFSEQARTFKTSAGDAQVVIPVNYVGKFRITEATREAFQLEPVRIVNPEEAAQPTATWSVFEKMPLDRRGSFKDALAAINPDFNVNEMAIGDFRRILETQFLPADNFPFDADSIEYEKLIDRYAFDGRSLGQIEKWVESQINSGNRKSGAFQPRPEEVHIKYRFNKESGEYTVDADGNLDTDGAFTPLGLAIARNLHVGSKVKFKENEEVIIDSLTAAGYDRDGTQIEPFSSSADVTEIDRLYIRKNRDFPYLFARLADRGLQRRENVVDRKQDNNLYDTAISKNLAQQIQERTRIQSALEFDNRNLESDRDTIIAMETRRQQEVEAMQEKIEQLEARQEALRNRLGVISRKTLLGSGTTPVSAGTSETVSQPVNIGPSANISQPSTATTIDTLSVPSGIITNTTERSLPPIVRPAEVSREGIVLPQGVPTTVIDQDIEFETFESN